MTLVSGFISLEKGGFIGKENEKEAGLLYYSLQLKMTGL